MSAKTAPSISVAIIAHGWSERKQSFFHAFPTVVIENNFNRKKGSKFVGVKVMVQPTNTGFAKAVNQAFQATLSDWVLILNDDCEPSIEQIQQLHAIAVKNKVEVLSPTLVNTQGQVQKQYQQQLPTFLSLLIEWSPLHRLYPEDVHMEKTLPGACIFISRNAFEKLNGWDERFWLWWEDTDFSFRLNESDIPFQLTTEVQMMHVGGETFLPLKEDWKKQVFFRSLRAFSKKHFPDWQQTILNSVTQRFDAHRFYPVDESLRASVVVPNVKKELLEEFLSKNAQKWDWSQDELIVVTSAKELTELKKKYPHVVWIHLTQNHGFASTANVGFMRARAAWVGTVNDDTVLPLDWIENLLKNAKKDTGSLNPVIAMPNGEVESAGILYRVRGKAEPIKDVQSAFLSDASNAAAVMYRRSALEKVGVFDERFGSYLEDVDLGLRLKKKGWKNVVVPTVWVTHFGQKTSSSRKTFTSWLNLKNWWLVVLKHTSLQEWLTSFFPILIERGRNFSGFLKSL